MRKLLSILLLIPALALAQPVTEFRTGNLTVNGGTTVTTLLINTAWTPTVGGNATYAVNSGFYTKIGNKTTATFRLNITVLGTGSTTTVSGLPAPGANGSIPYGGFCYYWTTLALTPVFVAPIVNGQTITFNIATAATNTLTANAAIFGNTAGIYCTVEYYE